MDVAQERLLIMTIGESGCLLLIEYAAYWLLHLIASNIILCIRVLLCYKILIIHICQRYGSPLMAIQMLS
jgi:hypothetical protein